MKIFQVQIKNRAREKETVDIFKSLVFNTSKKQRTQFETGAQISQVSKYDSHYLVELPPGNGVELTLKNVPVLEKYRMFASLTFFSAACGLTISRPCVHKAIMNVYT